MNGGAYILVVMGILIAKCIGFLRDIIFASTFGASPLTDIYFQIFSLASLVFTGIGGALSTLVIKNLNKTENALGDNGRRYVASFISKTAVITTAVTAVLYVLAGPVVRLLLPGLSDELFGEAVQIMYIMLPSCLFVIVAYIMSGVLQNRNVFFITSVMSLPYNVVIIASLFVPDVSMKTVSVVTTLGWFLHIVILMPAFIKKGYSFIGSIKPTGAQKGGNREVLYIFISSMMFQLVFMADKAAVSADSGAASTINYASNLFVTISSVFVVAMSNVSYPSLCRHYESGDMDKVKQSLRYILTVLLAIFAPFILTVNCFGTDIISLLYERGEFTKELSAVTAMLFSIYTLGIFGYVCQELLNKVLYLASAYKYTVIGTIAVVVAKPLINLMLGDAYGVVAVAGSTAALFTLYAISILLAIRKTVGNYLNKEIFVNFLKIGSASLAALMAFFVLRFLSLPLSDTKIGFLIPFAVCGFIYVLVLWVTGMVRYMVRRRNADEAQK